MRIRITTTFIDKQATDPDKAEVAAGSEITVTVDRGAELIGLGLAVEIDVQADKPATKRRTRKARPADPAPVSSPAVLDPPVVTDIQ